MATIFPTVRYVHTLIQICFVLPVSQDSNLELAILPVIILLVEMVLLMELSNVMMAILLMVMDAMGIVLWATTMAVKKSLLTGIQ